MLKYSKLHEVLFTPLLPADWGVVYGEHKVKSIVGSDRLLLVITLLLKFTVRL